MSDREPTREEWEARLREIDWLRDDGDGERLHARRNAIATNDAERCWGSYCSVCIYKRGHAGPHRLKSGTKDLTPDEWGELQRLHYGR